MFIFFKKNLTTYGNEGNSSNKTSYKDVMPFTGGFPERINSSYYQQNMDETKEKFFFSIKSLYSKTLDESNEELGDYFLPNGKSNILVFGGDDFFESTANYKFKRDIDSSIFDISDDKFFSNNNFTFSSKIKGLGADFIYCFFENFENLSDYCFKFFFPFFDITHKSKIKESIGFETIDGTNSIKKALSENIPSSIKFNFSENGVSNKGFGNIEVGINYRNKPCESIYMENLFGLILPSENSLNKNSSENNIFYPKIGNNGHFGIQYENQTTLNITEKENYSVRTILVNNSSYFFPSEQLRVFDVSHNPWSRYIKVYKNLNMSDEEINYLGKYTNLKCSVSPNFTFTSTSEIGLYKSNSTLKVGYSFHSRQAESIDIKEKLPELIFKNSNDPDKKYINPLRTSSLRYKNYDTLVNKDTTESALYKIGKIKTNDLDISSASHPAILVGNIYAKIGFENEIISFDAGTSYRHCYNNNALRYLTFWLSLGINF